MSILDVSAKKVRLESYKGFLRIISDEQEQDIPFDVLDALIIFSYDCSYTHFLLQRFCEQNIPLIICSQNAMPVGILSSVQQNVLRKQRVEIQTTVKASVKHRLWQQIIQKKIENQAGFLKYLGQNVNDLNYLKTQVLPNDTHNSEGVAARIYWQKLFGSNFRRDPDASGLNSLLNYGYIVIRATFCRCITASGLLPELGLHHQNQFNPFCLSDDLIEPYRVFVDKQVNQIADVSSSILLSPDIKKKLVAVLDAEVKMDGQKYHLRNAIQKTVESLINIFEKKETSLKLPSFS